MGQRVCFVASGMRVIRDGQQGTIRSFEGSSVGVEWDELPPGYGHDLNGNCESNRGFYVSAIDLKPVLEPVPADDRPF